MTETDVRVAYLTSRYPAPSHTFVLREVRALRRQGICVETYSIRRPSDSEILSEVDKDEHRRTTALLPARPLMFIKAHVSALVRRPGIYFATAVGAMRSTKSPRRALWQLFYFVEAIIMWNQLRVSGIRHIHAHMANVAADVARMAARFGEDDGLSWSFTMHGPTEFFDVSHYDLVGKAADADRVVCISNFCRSQLEATGADLADKSLIVHCGLNIGEYEFALRERQADATFRILCVGRLVPEKGQRRLVEAVGALRESGYDVRLTMVGDGPSRASLEKLIEGLKLGDMVELAGVVGQDSISSYYQSADVFCLPSSAEGVPVVLMEAMALGVPVISTKIAGIPELIEDGINGRLIVAGDDRALVGALAEVASHPELAAAWAIQARRKVEAEFDVTRSAALLADMFTEVSSE